MEDQKKLVYEAIVNVDRIHTAMQKDMDSCNKDYKGPLLKIIGPIAKELENSRRRIQSTLDAQAYDMSPEELKTTIIAEFDTFKEDLVKQVEESKNETLNLAEKVSPVNRKKFLDQVKSVLGKIGSLISSLMTILKYALLAAYGVTLVTHFILSVLLVTPVFLLGKGAQLCGVQNKQFVSALEDMKLAFSPNKHCGAFALFQGFKEMLFG